MLELTDSGAQAAPTARYLPPPGSHCGNSGISSAP